MANYDAKSPKESKSATRVDPDSGYTPAELVPLSDEELASALKWTRADVEAFKNVSRGKIERGAFATVAALKARQELAHPKLTKREEAAFAPVVIVIQEPARVATLHAPEALDAELLPALSPPPEAPPDSPPLVELSPLASSSSPTSPDNSPLDAPPQTSDKDR